MTSPPPQQPPPADQPEQPLAADQIPPPSLDPAQEAGSIVPVLTSILAAYVAYRLTHKAITGPWQRAADTLGITAMVAGVFAALAARGVSRQRRDAGRSGDELLEHMDAGVRAGVDAGVQAVVEILKDTDRRWVREAQAVPAAPEAGARGGQEGETAGTPAAPTNRPAGTAATDPATVRGQAEHLAATVIEAAQTETATAAGWYKRWHSKQDLRVRPSHRYLHGRSVAAGDPFTTPEGASIRYPHDPAAPLEEIIRCRCHLTWHRGGRPKSAAG